MMASFEIRGGKQPQSAGPMLRRFLNQILIALALRICYVTCDHAAEGIGGAVYPLFADRQSNLKVIGNVRGGFSLL